MKPIWVRSILTAGGFAVLGTSIAWGILGDPEENRQRALLNAIQRAETTLAYTSRRSVTTYHPGGESKAEFDYESRRGSHRTRPRGAGTGLLGWLQHATSVNYAHAGRLGRFHRADLVLKNYEVRIQGRETIGDRVTDRIEILPRRAGRSTYLVWADSETHLIVQLRVRDGSGNPVFDLTQDTVRYREPREDARPPSGRNPRRRAPIDIDMTPCRLEELKGYSAAVWLPSWLPAGFEHRSMERIRVKGLRTGDAIFASYTDGPSGILLFQLPADSPLWIWVRDRILRLGEGVPGEARRVQQAGGTLMNVRLEGTELLAIGQISGDEMERVIRSLRRIDR